MKTQARTILLSAVWIVQISTVFAQTQPIPVRLPAELDSLVAPIALYPDPLLSQVLVAVTYPLEIVDAAQWLQQNSALTGEALQNAARLQNWDPSVEALIAFPDVLYRLSGNIEWASDLGNAFTAQQVGVMDAVQRMRSQAVASSTLTSNAQAVVTTQPVAGATIVEIRPANPEVIYVPVYDPISVWGPAYYPYPVLHHTYSPVIVYPGRIGFTSRVFVGSLYRGWGGWNDWGWRPNWYSRTVIVNNNFFDRHGFRRVGPRAVVHRPSGYRTDPRVYHPAPRGHVQQSPAVPRQVPPYNIYRNRGGGDRTVRVPGPQVRNPDHSPNVMRPRMPEQPRRGAQGSQAGRPSRSSRGSARGASNR